MEPEQRVKWESRVNLMWCEQDQQHTLTCRNPRFAARLNLYPNLVSSNPSQSIIFDSIGKRLSSPFTIENRLISSAAVWKKEGVLESDFSLNTYWKSDVYWPVATV